MLSKMINDSFIRDRIANKVQKEAKKLDSCYFSHSYKDRLIIGSPASVSQLKNHYIN